MSNSHDDFQGFVEKEFEKTTKFSSLLEDVEFAFGSLEEAVDAFEKLKGKRYQTSEGYLEDEYFEGFVFDKFREVAAFSTEEEIADWACGSVEEAEEEFRESGRRNAD